MNILSKSKPLINQNFILLNAIVLIIVQIVIIL